jgi:hypothetical protein
VTLVRDRDGSARFRGDRRSLGFTDLGAIAAL